MTPRTETVIVSTLLSDPPPVITGPVAQSIVRALGLDPNYADSLARGFVETLDQFAVRTGSKADA
ncbi:hypothetical protein [Streptomyces sp. NRRL B-24720]|uniref:hypothetical protein n=1 Tax=Streptomyces sp. NRRL B-24720 TaxID=1476876 RepID=UPI0004C964FF|nr:hypothetical protein [Streptomyces sp. NRRL B-24720]